MKVAQAAGIVKRAAPSRTPRKVLKRKDLDPQNLILYADNALVALNKPRGLVSQSSRSSEPDSRHETDVFTSVLSNVRRTLSLTEMPKTVHRLDKPTSGLLILARTQHSARTLSRLIAQKEITKTYLALACGGPSDLPARGVMETTLICENGRIRVVGTASGRLGPPPLSEPEPGENWEKKAITKYRVLASSTKVPLSLVELSLVTGCKHQIRAQLAQYLNTPILGDFYGDQKKKLDVFEMLNLQQRPDLCLHSSRMDFTRYRRTGDTKKFEFGLGAPIPPGFASVCQAAGIALDREQASGGVWINGTKVRGPGAEEYLQSATNQETGDVEDEVGSIGGVWYGGGQ
ncbi:pseudouridine synthase [Lenzites betulinus]|nr:pseudouridine synthase [Lenzites betulinus]